LTADQRACRKEYTDWDWFAALAENIPAGIVSEVWEKRMNAGLRLRIAEIKLGFSVLAWNGVDGAEVHGLKRVSGCFVRHAAADREVIPSVKDDRRENRNDCGPLQYYPNPSH